MTIEQDFETVKEALDAFTRYAIYHGSEVTIGESYAALKRIERDMKELFDQRNQALARVRELELESKDQLADIDAQMERVRELEEHPITKFNFVKEEK